MDEQRALELTRDRADDFYLDAFRRIGSGKTIVWNWGAFFGTFMWAFYRKMPLRAFFYSIPILGFSALLLISIVYKFSHFSSVLKGGLFLWGVLAIWFGLFGTKMYYKRARRKIRKGYQRSRDYKSTTGDVLNCILCYLAIITVVSLAYGVLTFGGYIDISALVENSRATNDFMMCMLFFYIVGVCLLILTTTIVGLINFVKDKRLLAKNSNEPFNEEMTEDNILRLVSTKSEDYYLKKFKKIESGKIISPNITVFFACEFWLWHKKMYLPALAFTIISWSAWWDVFFKAGSEIANVISNVGLFIILILSLGGANHLYYRHIMKIIKEEKDSANGKTRAI
jgi:hypothetical protein